MQRVSCSMSVSLDGFISGPDHLDRGFYRVQDWAGRAFAWRERQGMEGGERNVDSDLLDELYANTGAYVMGRAMFDVGEEPWGETPPFQAPVFVVTHRARPVLERKGGTSFTFVTDGLESALDQARAAAGDKHVQISGGAKIVQQAIASRLLDELHLHIAPVLLGAGIRLFDDLPQEHIELTADSVVESPQTTHIRYRLRDA